MKSYQISSVQIPHLVSLSADLFYRLDHSIDPNPQKAIHIHYVVDLLKQFADIAYPIENQPNDIEKIAYKEFVNLLKLANLPDCLIPTFEQWKKQVKSIVIKQEGAK